MPDHSLLNELRRVLKTDQHDALGPDPFGLRSFIPDTTAMLSFPELLSQYDYASLPLEPSNGFENIPHLLPNRAHFIYIINPLLKPIRRDTIAEFKRLNPSYATTVWVDKHTYDQSTWDEFIQWAQANQIHVLDAREILGNRMGCLEKPYLLETARRRPGGASDTLRLAIIKNVGGLYCDTDVVCIEPIGNVYSDTDVIFCDEASRIGSFEIHPLEMVRRGKSGEPKTTTNNDIIFARPEHPDIETFSQRIANNYTKTLVALFGNQSINTALDFGPAVFKGKKPTYPDNGLTMPTEDIIKAYTINCSGPTELRAMLPHPAVNRQDFFNKFRFGSEISWFAHNVVHHDALEIENVKVVITGLLFDLTKEARVLRLDAYNEFYGADTLTTALTLICEFYPHLLAQVTKIYHRHVDLPIHLIVDKNYFPVLDTKSILKDYVRTLIAGLHFPELKTIPPALLRTLDPHDVFAMFFYTLRDNEFKKSRFINRTDDLAATYLAMLTYLNQVFSVDFFNMRHTRSEFGHFNDTYEHPTLLDTLRLTYATNETAYKIMWHLLQHYTPQPSDNRVDQAVALLKQYVAHKPFGEVKKVLKQFTRTNLAKVKHFDNKNFSEFLLLGNKINQLRVPEHGPERVAVLRLKAQFDQLSRALKPNLVEINAMYKTLYDLHVQFWHGTSATVEKTTLDKKINYYQALLTICLEFAATKAPNDLKIIAELKQRAEQHIQDWRNSQGQFSWLPWAQPVNKAEAEEKMSALINIVIMVAHNYPIVNVMTNQEIAILLRDKKLDLLAKLNQLELKPYRFFERVEQITAAGLDR